MKKIILLTVISAALLLAGCDKEPAAVPGQNRGAEVVFTVEALSRAAHDYPVDHYFNVSEELKKITVSYTNNFYTYVYENGILKGIDEKNTIRFPQDGSSLSNVELRWPCDEVSASYADGVLKDQSTLGAFMAMDRLNSQVTKVRPTVTIAVTFRHSRSKITFTLAGENAGKRIESLEIGNFKAWCDPSLSDAQLMYDQQADHGSLPVRTPGLVKIQGNDQPLEFMLADSPDEVLRTTPGNYTVMINL